MQDQRKWFVDLQIQIDLHFNPVMNGVIYLCNLCFDAKVLDTLRQAQAYEGITYDGETPTYENKKELLTEIEFEEQHDEPEPDTGTVRDPIPSRINPSASIFDEDSAGSESESTDDSDGERKPLSEFRTFFGGKSRQGV